MTLRPPPAARLLPILSLLSGCSPIYAYKSVAGHAKLLWRRRSIDKALADPGTPPELKTKLRVVVEAREFAFSRMRLSPSRSYRTYSPVDGPAVTYLVSASPKTRLELYLWHFPLIGAFPYKGYFRKEDALREKSRLERRGYDATVGGAIAYNTGLWIPDPLPTSALGQPPGEIASLVIHELAHGTVWFKNRTDFDEELATFFGEEGAKEFLAERFGRDSPELKEFQGDKDRDRAFAAAIEEIYAKLEALYRGPLSDAEKLEKREEIFRWGLGRCKEAGVELRAMNNAVVLSHRLYLKDMDLFRIAYEHAGRDWTKLIALLRGLDPRDPEAGLRRAVGFPPK